MSKPFLLFFTTLFLTTSLQAELIDGKLRFLSQGGFTDKRSPLGVLGGGQLTLDTYIKDASWGISISGEYYTNSSAPTESFEIAGATFFNLLYRADLFNSPKSFLFAAVGTGYVDVPVSGTNGESFTKNIAYDAELGLDIHLFWKISFYGIYKYLYSYKSINNSAVIDFNEHIALFGLIYAFSL